MSCINCSINDCANNCSNQCSLGSVDVCGGGDKENTCCSSFVLSNGLQSSAQSPCSNQLISCDAKDCMHNESCTCQSSSINMCSNLSSCSCDDDTHCGSFFPR